jgi:ADP-ribose pyrophosphatase YjhB (NUDIX family)
MSENADIRMRATLVAHDEHGRLLLVRQGHGGDTYWVLPGGGVEFGETIEKAVEREIREELGVGVEVGRLLAIGELIDEGRHVVDFFLTGHLERNEGLNVRFEEGIAESAWVERSELGGRRILPPEIIPVLEEASGGETGLVVYLGRYDIKSRSRQI